MLAFMKKKFAPIMILSALVISKPAFCDYDWSLVNQNIQNSKSIATYENVKRHLELLVSNDLVETDSENRDILVIAKGYITISPEAIRSYRNPGEYSKRDARPEFEYRFAEKAAVLDESKNPSDSNESRVSLKGIQIAIDVQENVEYFNHLKFDDLSYSEFVHKIQVSLTDALEMRDATVSHLRPRIELKADTVDLINRAPPHIVISPQFNNYKQDLMVTFCGGNILENEFKTDRIRARFIESALTQKHFSSVQLGACLMRFCQSELAVKPLHWKNASFQGNARPVPSGCVSPQLDSDDRFANGIATRNLIHNGLFSKSVIIPFPDMQWAQKQVSVHGAEKWIKMYTDTIAKSIQEYVNKTPGLLN